MEISLRDARRVNTNSLLYTIKNWRVALSSFEKSVISILILFIVLTSTRWAYAAKEFKAIVPRSGGTFVEGVTGEAIDNIDLGRLTKAALVKTDPAGQVTPDLATRWEISADKLTYRFTLDQKISANELASILEKNPTYLTSGAMPEIIDAATLAFKLDKPDSEFLNSLSHPLFPYGPYTVDKKTKNEIRLKARKDYHLQMPYIQKFTIRVYPDQKSLEKAVQKGSISATADLDQSAGKYQQMKLVLAKKHVLFINSSKTYLKKTAVREKLLNGEKPDSIQTLDVLEVNGALHDTEYEQLKEKLKAAGIDLKVRQVALKDALTGDLPKRQYDLLYILTDDAITRDPYALWNSSQRSGVGQNFAELANADVDELTSEYNSTDDPAKKTELLAKIKELVDKEKVAVEYKNIEASYFVSPKVKGMTLGQTLFNESSRFDFVPSWYFFEKKQR